MKLSQVAIIFLMLISTCTSAQVAEEVMVTGIRASSGDLPGVLLKKQADFILLEINVTNDSRDPNARNAEIQITLKNAINEARKTDEIQLSVVKDGFVLPLDEDELAAMITTGNRPDTSEVAIRAKAVIGADVANPEKLLQKLVAFVRTVPVEGRTQLLTVNEVDVSVVNPSQYRNEIVDIIAADIKRTTATIGPDYKVIVSGLDSPVRWERTGPVQLALYIQYSYQIIPNTIQSYFNAGDY